MADVEFGRLCACNGARFRDRFVRVLQHRPSFVQERATGLCQANRFCRAFEQKETQLIFKITNLAA